jgi:hypothetical protein
MAGQSRVPQGTVPRTHQWVVLAAVNDSGTKPDDNVGLTVESAATATAVPPEMPLQGARAHRTLQASLLPAASPGLPP